MTYVMKLIDQPEQVASIELAGALLRAWVRGDRPALAAELDRSSRTPTEQQDAGEEERLEMLAAIAARMKAYRDPFATGDRDAGIGVCLKMLSHLAGPTMHGRANCAGWYELRWATRLETPGFVRSKPARPETLTCH